MDNQTTIALLWPQRFCFALIALLGVTPQMAAAQPGLSERPASQTCLAPERPPVESIIDLEQVLSVDFPVAMVQAPNNNNRWYVVDRAGSINIFLDGTTFAPVGTFINLDDRITRELNGVVRNEMGLLGLAFHPNFASNGYVYVYYSAVGTSAGWPLEARLSRFRSPDGGLTLDPDSELLILKTDRDHQSHWAGSPQFGDDGYLYLSMGDAGLKENGQDLSNLHGKMIRIDVDGGSPYAIPADNPYAAGGGQPEIFASGFRNPWRWSIDRTTDEIWLGDVGWDEYEEINLIEKGGNYGWNIREGFNCTFLTPCSSAGLIDPEFGYAHDPAAAFNAIIGGYVYRGSTLQNLNGVYLYADNYTGKVFALRYDTNGDPYPELLIESNQFVTSFAESNQKEIFLLAQYGIYRLINPVPRPPDTFPKLLSETGCFNPANMTIPTEGLIPYDLNTPLWTDGASKQRWMALPQGEQITLDANGDFVFPMGTVLVKNFSVDEQLVETRLFIHHYDGAWGGYSYEWNAGLTDAVLLPAGKTKPVGSLTWTYPSRSQCMQCHTDVSGRAIGPEIAQLNRDFLYSDTGITANQLETLDYIGLFATGLPDTPANLPKLVAVGDTTQSLEDRARSYLHANCAHCHQPSAPGQGPEDFRYWISTSQMGAINEAPTQGDLGITDASLISPGDPQKSILSRRMHSLDLKRMPPLGTSTEDTVATSLIDSWITAMQNSDICGAPIYAPGSEAAVYIWETCGTGVWQIWTTGGGNYSRVVAELSSQQNLSAVKAYSLESHDFFNTDSPNQVSFDFQMWGSSEDGFEFDFAPGSSTCLTIESPEDIPIYWGPAGTLTTSPFDLETQGACGATPLPPSAPETFGKPAYNPAVNAGLFLWQQQDGIWQLRTTAGGDYAHYIGNIAAESAFPSITGYSLETHDSVDFSTDPSRVDFNMQIWTNGEDGLTFEVPATGISCLEMEQPNPNTGVVVGAGNTLVIPPFDLRTLEPCNTSVCHASP